VVVDPGGRLAEEEAAVPAGRSRADAAALDDRDALTALGEEARDRQPRDPPADDDGVGAQLSVDGLPPSDFLRQKRSAPPTAASVPTSAAAPTAKRDLDLLAGVASFAFRLSARFAIGLAAL
jgi:hypothetical protein